MYGFVVVGPYSIHYKVTCTGPWTVAFADYSVLNEPYLMETSQTCKPNVRCYSYMPFRDPAACEIPVCLRVDRPARVHLDFVLTGHGDVVHTAVSNARGWVLSCSVKSVGHAHFRKVVSLHDVL